MSLLIHRAERADRLVDALGDLLSDPLPDPFATEIVSVPTPGVERWLSQRLSARLGARPGHADGVCAGVDFCPPSRLVARALYAGRGFEATDPWRPEQVVWPLLRVIDDARGEDWARLLWAHLEGCGGRRWSRRGSRVRTSTPPVGHYSRTGHGRPSSGAGCGWRSTTRGRPSRWPRQHVNCGSVPRRPTSLPGCRSSAPPGWTRTVSLSSPRSPCTVTSTSGC